MSSRLHLFCIALAVCALVRIVTGALVTAGTSAAADLHRFLSPALSSAFALVVLILFQGEYRAWVRVLALVTLVVSAPFGFLEFAASALSSPAWGAFLTGMSAQIFFALISLLATAISRSWPAGDLSFEDHGWPSMRFLAWVATPLVFTQVLLGGAYRHQLAGALYHVVGALVVGGFLLMLATFVLTQFGQQNKRFRGQAIALLASTVAQIVLGIAAYTARLTQPEGSAGTGSLHLGLTHMVVGAAIFAKTLQLTVLLLRHVHPESAPGATAHPSISTTVTRS